MTHGYTYDESDLAPSPVSRQDLEELKISVLWSDADRDALRRAGDILIPQTEAILDVWYDFIGSNQHLVSVFAGQDGQPNADYLAGVRGRFGLWIKDICTRDYDEQWLAYQEEIGLRHTPAKKNQTDGVDSPVDNVPLRHLFALVVPVTITIREFLEKGEQDPAEVEAMYQAWFKAVTLSVVLWARPYSGDLW